ncbi:MAG TPA: zinc-dependent alcohol dehydrogenase family protein [Candidatus Marinimicrobia bacterium]|nr:zinc-dependent alcohol dehydrogenase family protein [Candidatus Neomarinimicrobiota bacterium]
MKAYFISEIKDLKKTETPLTIADVEQPRPTSSEILIKVSVCGICHTELDEIEGRTPPSLFPMILGHQVIGRIIENGPDAHRFAIGTRVGVAWIFSACGKCSYCLSDQENLCPQFRATGRDANGGYAEFMTVREDFAYPIPEIFTDAEAAPLLCAGAIGYRSLRLTNLYNGQKLGLTGFGASAHLVLKMVRHRFPQTPVYVFARSENEQAFARELGAVWAGETNEPAPGLLDAIIDTTPVWTPIVAALKNLKPGGRLVINAIRKENTDKSILTTIDYPEHLWLEKEIKSVANVTRRDVAEFLELAAEIPIKPEVELYPFEDANRALMELKQRHVRGAKVLQIS